MLLTNHVMLFGVDTVCFCIHPVMPQIKQEKQKSQCHKKKKQTSWISQPVQLGSWNSDKDERGVKKRLTCRKLESSLGVPSGRAHLLWPVAWNLALFIRDSTKEGANQFLQKVSVTGGHNLCTSQRRKLQVLVFAHTGHLLALGLLSKPLPSLLSLTTWRNSFVNSLGAQGFRVLKWLCPYQQYRFTQDFTHLGISSIPIRGIKNDISNASDQQGSHYFPSHVGYFL